MTSPGAVLVRCGEGAATSDDRRRSCGAVRIDGPVLNLYSNLTIQKSAVLELR